MNKKKIIKSSLVLGLAFSILSPVVDNYVGDNFLIINEVYAAGEAVDLGEGRTVEIVKDPKVTIVESQRRVLNEMSFNIKGFKEGDKLRVYDSDPMRWSNIDNFDNPYKISDYSSPLLTNGIEIFDNNSGVKIGEVKDGGSIVFNKNIDLFDSVKIVFKDLLYLHVNPSYLNSNENAPDIKNFISMVLETKEKEFSQKHVLEFSIPVVKDTMYSFTKPFDGHHSGYHVLGEKEDSSLNFYIKPSVSFKNNVKKGDILNVTLRIPDELKPLLDKLPDKNSFRDVLKDAYRMNDFDYKNGYKNRYNISSKNFKFTEDDFDVKFNESYDEKTKETLYDYEITNKGGLVNNERILIETEPFYFNLKRDHMKFEGFLANISNPRYTLGYDLKHIRTNDKGESIIGNVSSRMRGIVLRGGYIDAYGIWRPNSSKKITGTEKIVEVGSKVKPSDFVLNPDRLPKDTKFEYVDKTPDTSKVISKDPVKIKVIYPDGKIEETTGLLTVIPVDKSKFVTINYELENGTKVKSEEVLKTDATKVTTPETKISQGYELINWVKK